jgi:hypothetical protein
MTVLPEAEILSLAAGAAVLTYRFWTAGLKTDPTILGKTIRLGVRSATIVGAGASLD